MASRTRNPDWEEDLELKDDLELYVQRNLSQSEILDLMEVHYPMYAWSLRTLSRRLQHFGIKFINYAIDVEDVKRAVVKEMDGPGRLLGYRALHKKIRELHGLRIPRQFALQYAAKGIVVIAVMPWVTRGFAMRATRAALWSMASMGHEAFFFFFFFAMASMGRVARLK